MNRDVPLTVAIPKGRLQRASLGMLKQSGIHCPGLESSSRRLVIPVPGTQWRFLLAKPSDVPTYVEYGAADVGIVGKDILLEHGKDVAELLDLQFGQCSLIVAVPEKSGIADVKELDFHSRVATVFPRITAEYFSRRGIQAEIVELKGSVELGPMVGLSDAIVDITETGITLLENGLIPIAEIARVSARLIANQVSYKVKHGTIRRLVAELERVLEAQTMVRMEE